MGVAPPYRGRSLTRSKPHHAACRPYRLPFNHGSSVAGEPEVAVSEASDMPPGERVGDPTLGVELSRREQVAKPSMSACKGLSCVIRTNVHSLFQGVGGSDLRRSQLGHPSRQQQQ